jgi:hypothetical protein
MGLLDALLNGIQSETDTAGKGAGSGWLGSLVKAAAPPTEPAQGSPAMTLPLVSAAGMSAPVVGSQAPGLLDRLTAGATNLTTGGNPLAGILNAVNGVATGQRTDRAGIELAKQHATMSALINAGLDFKTARAAAMNPEYLKALVVARYGVRPKHGQATAASRPAGNETDRSEPIATNDVDANSRRTGVPSADTAKPQS